VQAKELDEHEAAEQGPDHGAGRVGRVQLAEAGAGLVQGADQVAGEQWQGHPHEERRRRHRRKGEGEPDAGQLARPLDQAGPDAPVHLGQPAEGERQQGRHGGHGQLDQAVQAQRPEAGVGQPAADQTAEAEAGHERGHDGRHRLGGVAEHQHELA
jgi:hypothetical protein